MITLIIIVILTHSLTGARQAISYVCVYIYICIIIYIYIYRERERERYMYIYIYIYLYNTIVLCAGAA